MAVASRNLCKCFESELGGHLLGAGAVHGKRRSCSVPGLIA